MKDDGLQFIRDYISVNRDANVRHARDYAQKASEASDPEWADYFREMARIHCEHANVHYVCVCGAVYPHAPLPYECDSCERPL